MMHDRPLSTDARPLLISLTDAAHIARAIRHLQTVRNCQHNMTAGVRFRKMKTSHCLFALHNNKYNRSSPLLFDLHWLRVPERIKFHLAVLVFHCRNQTAPKYLSRELQWTVYDEPRRQLRSASSNRLIIRRPQLRTASDRTFSAAAPRLWNSLPADVVTSQSLATFKEWLKTFLFKQSHH